MAQAKKGPQLHKKRTKTILVHSCNICPFSHFSPLGPHDTFCNMKVTNLDCLMGGKIPEKCPLRETDLLFQFTEK
jgi:hypothetical protein